MKQSELKYLMDVAELTAQRSKATRSKVGYVLLDSDEEFIATGYNGTIRGFHIDIPEYTNASGDLVTDEDICIHAEQNSLMHAARRGLSLRNGTAVGTLSPCSKCCALMIQAGIKTVYYKERYRTFDKTESLYKNYINLQQYVA